MKIRNSNNEHRQTALAPKSYFLEKKLLIDLMDQSINQIHHQHRYVS